MLILSSHIQRKRPPFLNRRSSHQRVEARLIRPAIVVVDRLSQVIAVPQHRPADSHQPRIRGLQSIHHSARPASVRNLTAQLRQQLCQNLLGLFIVAVDDGLLRLPKHVQNASPRPRPHPQKHGVEIAQAIQPRQFRIHPVIHGNINRSREPVRVLNVDQRPIRHISPVRSFGRGRRRWSYRLLRRRLWLRDSRKSRLILWHIARLLLHRITGSRSRCGQ